MNVYALVSASALLFAHHAAIGRNHSEDTTATTIPPRPYHLSVTTRLHSKGMFNYSGRFVSDNPALDFNLRYERARWGYTFFKAMDLGDRHSDNNFALTSLFLNVRIGEIVKFVPQIAFRMDESRGSFAAKGSDAIFILTTSLRLVDQLYFEHTALFSNVMLEQQSFDWVNRYRLLFTGKHVDLAAMVYNNTSTFDDNSYVSGGLQCAYSRIKLSEHMLLSAGATGLKMFRTSDKVDFPKHNGIMFSMAITVH